MLSEFLSNVLRNQGFSFSHSGFTEDVQAFYHAVNWEEPWIIGWGLVVLFLLLVILFSLQQTSFHFLILAFLAALGYLLETFNDFAHENWALFSSQDYFQKDGKFVAIVFGLPIMLLQTIIVINLLVKVWSLLNIGGRVKARQLSEQRKKRE
eukprot:GCRY01000834.1.p1 GENE.GCRY01000834.1~~GCRY01000834.1.p1  ORF type:complete len:152 (-),score=15.00 GCRY01000834.1:72-527(-)